MPDLLIIIAVQMGVIILLAHNLILAKQSENMWMEHSQKYERLYLELIWKILKEEDGGD